MSLKSQSNLRTNSLQYLENEPLNVLKLIVDRILWTEMIEISFVNIFWQKYIEKNFYNSIAILWKWVAPSMSLKPHSNTRKFFFDGFENELYHLCPLNCIQIFEKNPLQYLVNEPLNILKLIVDRTLWIEMIEISCFNIFLTNIYRKNFYNFIAIPWKWVAPSMSLNPIQTPDFFFSMGSKMNCAIYVS